MIRYIVVFDGQKTECFSNVDEAHNNLRNKMEGAKEAKRDLRCCLYQTNDDATLSFNQLSRQFKFLEKWRLLPSLIGEGRWVVEV